MPIEQTDGRPILNAHMGMTNNVPTHDLRDALSQTMQDIVDLLLRHCGPRGHFAMIVDANNPTTAPHCTKDGINIIRGLEYISPIERIIRNELAHIGQQAERKVGDGTTSAMIVCAVAAIKMLGGKISGDDSTITKMLEEMSFEEFRHEFDSFRKELLENDLRVVNTIDELCEEHPDQDRQTIIRRVVLWQAMTSSHGDRELSDAAVEVFSQMPEEAWSKITFQRETYETQERIRLEEDTDQYTIKAQPLFDSYLNDHAGTKFKQDNCDLIVINNSLNEHDIPSIKALQLMKSSKKEKRPVMIVCPAGIDQMFGQRLRDETDSDSAVFVVRMQSADYTDLTGLQYVAGVPIANSDDSVRVIKDVKVRYENHQLHFNRLYDNPQQSLMHPDIEKPNSLVSKALQDIDQVIDQLETDLDEGQHVTAELKRLRILHNKVKYTKRYTIHIGGSARSNAHAFDLVSDTLMAVKNSLVYGFESAANFSPYFICLGEGHQIDRKGHDCLTMRDYFWLSFRSGFGTIMNSLDKSYEKNATNAQINISNLVSDQIVPIQPSTLLKLILDQFEDVFLKYLFTDRIIVPGMVYKPETKLREFDSNRIPKTIPPVSPNKTIHPVIGNS